MAELPGSLRIARTFQSGIDQSAKVTLFKVISGR